MAMIWIGFVLLMSLAMSDRTGAQEVTGHLEGRVQDELGSALVGVNIRVTGPGAQGARGAVADETGFFRVLGLPVGTYEVAISHVSYQGVRVEEVTVQLGKTTSLGVLQLQEQALGMDEIVVSGGRSLIDPTTASMGSNLSAYQDLPIERNFRSMTALVPQANTSYLGDEVNISGSTGLENAYYIDGIHVTDPFRATTSTNLPYNFIREVEIKTGGYEAEYGRSMGGIVNAVTYSGGNEFHGQVFGFFTDHRLAGSHRGGAAGTQIGDFATYDAGFSLGGPLVRDRLWFFAAYNPNFEVSDVVIPGLGVHEDRKTAHLFSGKLTWQASAKTNLALTVLGDPSNRNRIGFTFQGMPFPSQLENPDPFLGSIEEGGISFSLKGQHAVSDNLLIDASLAQMNRRENDVPGTARGYSDPFDADFTTGIWGGGYGRIWENDSQRTALKVSGALFTGQHSLKAGVEYEDNALDQLFTNRSGDGTEPGLYVRVAPETYIGIWSVADFTVHNRVVSAFVQDSWQVNSQLRINAGLRWDGQYMIGQNGEVAQKIADQFQPRLGFVYQPDIGQKVSGSFGRFYEQMPTIVSNYNHIEWTYFTYIFAEDPLAPSEAVATIDDGIPVRPEVSGLEGQFHDEFSLGYERQIGDQYKVGVRGVYRELRQAIEVGFEPNSGQYVLGNPGQGELSFLPELKRRYTALELRVERMAGEGSHLAASYVLSRNRGNYGGLFEAEEGSRIPNNANRYLDRIENQMGLLPNDRTHVLKFYGSRRFDNRLTAGASFSWQSGTPLSEFANGLRESDVLFVNPRGSAGRTPAIWDLNARLSYDLQGVGSGAIEPRLVLDVFHLFSRREAVNFDQTHYLSIDENRDPDANNTNPNYGLPSRFQPPMTVRLGFEVAF